MIECVLRSIIMSCNCIEEVNKNLEEKWPGKNTQLDIPISLNINKGELRAQTVIIKTKKLDNSKRQKPVTIVPSFCPFCGEKY